MKPFTALTLCALLSLCMSARAADLTGTWQADGKPQRVLKVHKAGHGYHGDFYDLGPEAAFTPRYNSVSGIFLSGNDVHYSLDKADGSFDGTLSNDGRTLAGTWNMLYFPAQAITFVRASAKDAWVPDPSLHKTHFVTVQHGVRLEVLDWGGSGPPLIFLAGLGGTGHSFDGFAEKFTGKHHVYAITRRGFGASSVAPLTDANYDADRMGDDVVAVMEALQIEKPVLAGHSNAGQELSSVGTRYPDRIAGLIYLESLYSYAFYNPAQPDLMLDAAAVRRALDQLSIVGNSSSRTSTLVKETQAALVNLEQALKDTDADMHGIEYPPGGQGLTDLAEDRIVANARRYGAAPVPVLAIVALPRRCAPQCDTPSMKRIMANDAARADLYEKTAPHARVIRIANASHFIWRSNEAQVEQEMNGFMDGLH